VRIEHFRNLICNGVPKFAKQFYKAHKATRFYIAMKTIPTICIRYISFGHEAASVCFVAFASPDVTAPGEATCYARSGTTLSVT
jgi:hypothetical protein